MAVDTLFRLAGAVLVEAHDEWQTGGRRYIDESSMALLAAAVSQELMVTSALMIA